ncbi:glutamate [Alicycliphilus sp. B1]|nr:glutamate [Alicycliphilus sp. B1]
MPLRERGVEYVEVRLMDLDPFESVGITAATMRLLDVFLLHCLLTDSPPDTPQEIAECKHNQHQTAERGREPGLLLQRRGQSVALADWAAQVLDECAPIAAALDQAQPGQDYAAALRQARAVLADSALAPSARVLAAMQAQPGCRLRGVLVRPVRQGARPAPGAALERPAAGALRGARPPRSLAEQKDIEAQDQLPFEEWRQQYMDPRQLG